MTDFELLGLPKRFLVDKAALESAYFERIKAYHPDNCVGASPEAQTQALQKTLSVNQAYKRLQQPLHRAEYWLTLAGVDTRPEAYPTLPGAFLMEQMAWRERAEKATTPDERHAIREELASKEAHYLQAFANVSETPHALAEQGLLLLAEWRYFHKLAETIDR